MGTPTSDITLVSFAGGGQHNREGRCLVVFRVSPFNLSFKSDRERWHRPLKLRAFLCFVSRRKERLSSGSGSR